MFRDSVVYEVHVFQSAGSCGHLGGSSRELSCGTTWWVRRLRTCAAGTCGNSWNYSLDPTPARAGLMWDLTGTHALLLLQEPIYAPTRGVAEMHNGSGGITWDNALRGVLRRPSKLPRGAAVIETAGYK